MKKETLQLVLRIYQRLKFDISHPNLEELFEASKTQAQFTLECMVEENPSKTEKYHMMINELDKLTFDNVYKK